MGAGRTGRIGQRAGTAVAILALVVTGCATQPAPDEADAPPDAPSGAPSGAGPADPTSPSADGPATSRSEARDTPAPTPPRSAAQVVARLTAAERVIGDRSADADTLARAAQVQQLAYRRLAQRPGWDAEVFAALPPGLRFAARKNVASRREFLSMQRGYRPNRTLPAWRIEDPLPAGELRSIFQDAERRYGVDWEYLAAINLVETGMGRIRGTSVAGARGPMQFIPATWEAYGRGDIDDPRDAVPAAARYLRARGFTQPRGRGIDRALYAYNNDVRYVRAVRHLAEVMQARPRSYLAYHAWQVFYTTELGDVLLPTGYAERDPVPVRRWLRANPQQTS